MNEQFELDFIAQFESLADEQLALDYKIQSLINLTEYEDFHLLSYIEKKLIYTQISIMKSYFDILDCRMSQIN